MDIDETLLERMQDLALREAQIVREKEEARYFAQQELHSLESKILNVQENLNELEKQKRKLLNFLGEEPSNQTAERLPHGQVKRLCLLAIE